MPCNRHRQFQILAAVFTKDIQQGDADPVVHTAVTLRKDRAADAAWAEEEGERNRVRNSRGETEVRGGGKVC